MKYYDRDQIPISAERWAELHADHSYVAISRTKLVDAADTRRGYDVSTVWLGINHGFGLGLPLVFETLILTEGTSDEVECRRYVSEQQARNGHTETVAMLAVELTDPIVMDTTDQVT